MCAGGLRHFQALCLGGVRLSENQACWLSLVKLTLTSAVESFQHQPSDHVHHSWLENSVKYRCLVYTTPLPRDLDLAGRVRSKNLCF